MPRSQEIRPPAVAGYFYPAGGAALRAAVEACLSDSVAALDLEPRALLAPHAGYIYSGRVAAAAYGAIGPRRAAIRRVLLIGPSHHVPFEGLALPVASIFSTPLGDVPVDAEAVARVAALPMVRQIGEAHAREHSLEVHLPFLQTVLSEFSLVPLVVGQATTRDVARVLAAFVADEHGLIIVSSDLSHYHPYGIAERLDTDTLGAVERLDASIGPERACGFRPLNGLLETAQQGGLAVRVLAACNSGDTAGDRASVVGYAAAAFFYNRY